MRLRQLTWYWGPVLLYGTLIFFLSSQSSPGQYLPGLLFGLSDKILHSIEFGILAVLLYRAFKNTVRTKWAMGWAIFCAMAYGLSDEIHQWFVPNREAELFDLLADSVGATILVLTWAYFSEKHESQALDSPSQSDVRQ